MTMAILSAVFRSTSGLAPVLSATIRFWIRVESLKRPPTLLMIPSSFKSSSIWGPFKSVWFPLTAGAIPFRGPLPQSVALPIVEVESLTDELPRLDHGHGLVLGLHQGQEDLLATLEVEVAVGLALCHAG